MSTEYRSAAGAEAPAAERRERRFDPDSAYRLSPHVALRPESFGALAYHFGTRKLSFLKTPRLVTIVQSLAEHASARAAVDAGCVAEAERDSYLRALASLARTDMIVRC